MHTSTRLRPGSRPGRCLVLGPVLAIVLAACGGGALGLTAAPASLDPNSPTLVANNAAFDRNEITVPATSSFVLVFENRDDLDHNVSIYADDAANQRTFDGVIFKSGTRWYPVPALAPGRYFFRCDVHPDMNGHLFVT